ncbi:forkhead box protein L2-like [Schistocerca serialis cubense]|uniref:forkhead box protein L2-like n=1 Tax=Schistocerca serialis cubense TaxID=2023355 RepID=UPI00214E25DA|nr:forkhead box protein L2-like [Schistocerca serialis cubense]
MPLTCQVLTLGEPVKYRHRPPWLRFLVSCHAAPQEAIIRDGRSRSGGRARIYIAGRHRQRQRRTRPGARDQSRGRGPAFTARFTGAAKLDRKRRYGATLPPLYAIARLRPQRPPPSPERPSLLFLWRDKPAGSAAEIVQAFLQTAAARVKVSVWQQAITSAARVSRPTGYRLPPRRPPPPPPPPPPSTPAPLPAGPPVTTVGDYR